MENQIEKDMDNEMAIGCVYIGLQGLGHMSSISIGVNIFRVRTYSPLGYSTWYKE